MTEQQINRDELLAWCRNRPSDGGLTTMYNHELRYIVDALDQAEARIKAVREWHWGDKSRFGHYCSECGGEYPCDTIRALESDPPPSV